MTYLEGDEVQIVEPWTPPDTWGGLDDARTEHILADIDAGLPDGNRYSDANSAKERAAWKVVLKHASEKTEGQAREIIKSWVRNGSLESHDYENPKSRKPEKGLRRTV